MLKSSSLCLYSSNLGTFWLKIEQFWPFEEISIFNSWWPSLQDGTDGHNIENTTQGAFQQSFEIGSVVSEEISSPLFLICIIGQNRQKFKVHKKSRYMLKSSSLCLYSSNLGTFWLKREQFWQFQEISIFSHGGHLDTGRR